MIFGVVGLGLIGGSLARAIKAKRGDKVFGFDINLKTVEQAKQQNAIDDFLSPEKLKLCDVILIALYPKDVIDFVEQNSDNFKDGAVIIDCAGVKLEICERLFKTAKTKNFTFIGGHPMAGVAKTGFDGSFENMFKKASMIVVLPENLSNKLFDEVKEIFYSLGFATITKSTAVQHDKIIAFSSQLAHVISSAYVKSNTATEYGGFSAGSFRDMTRVAWLNEELWSRLFIDNREFLSDEISVLINHLSEYKAALDNNDFETLRGLLKDGREIKEKLSDAERGKNFEQSLS